MGTLLHFCSSYRILSMKPTPGCYELITVSCPGPARTVSPIRAVPLYLPYAHGSLALGKGHECADPFTVSKACRDPHDRRTLLFQLRVYHD